MPIPGGSSRGLFGSSSPVEARIRSATVEIFHKSRRVATHARRSAILEGVFSMCEWSRAGKSPTWLIVNQVAASLHPRGKPTG